MQSSIKRGTISISLYSIVFMVTGYAINFWLARLFGPTDYGNFGIIITLVSLVNLICAAGIPQALAKYAAHNEADMYPLLKSGLILQTVFTLVLSLILIVSANLISTLLNDKSLAPHFVLSALSFPLYGILMTYSGLYNGLHLFEKQALLNIFYSTIRLVSILVLAYLFHLTGVIIGLIISPLISLIVGIKLPYLKVKPFPYRMLLSFAFPLICFAFLSIIFQSIDLYFVKSLLISELDPGYYTANQNISRIPYFALGAFSVVLFPSISRNLAQKQIEKIRFLIHKSLRLILILLIPGTLLIAATSEQIIHLLYSTAYLPAAPSLSILIFASGFLTVFTVLANILNGAGEPKKSLWISALGVAITTFSCLFMVPKYGLVGAALSTTLGSFVAMVIATYFVYKRFRALIPINSVLKIILASLVIYFLTKIISVPVILLPLLYIILFGIYIFMLILLKEVTKDDWKQIRGLIPTWIPFV